MIPKLHADWIDPKAIQIVDSLQRKGFEAYLVGGCVRDLLVNHPPKDFDIATSATPEEVRKVIHNSYLIGRRFKLVLVRRGLQQYEVSTFRRSRGPEDDESEVDGIVGDNFFGTVKEDALRRDFTVNALFYDPIKKDLLDYCQGDIDIQKRLIRFIGDPIVRIHEDPIRILRGIRLSHKIGFSIDSDFKQAIISDGHTLLKAILPRKREEFIKIIKLPDPYLAFIEMFDLGILQIILPTINEIFQNAESSEIFSLYIRKIKNDIQLNIMQKDISVADGQTEAFNLFMLLLFSVYKSHSNFKLLSIDELEENKEFNKFLRDELGVFKQEAIGFFRNIRFTDALIKKDIFLRKGERRKKAFLNNPELKIANQYARIEHEYKYSDFYFWQHLSS